MLTFIIRFLNRLNNKWHCIYNSLCHYVLNDTIIHLVSIVIVVWILVLQIIIIRVVVVLNIIILVFLIHFVVHLNFKYLPIINITNNI
ncbi:hypothetical protein HanIR_Chr05g0232721 [Helianthus annuus]|nr:hypothetical protein HanIR_Chr05g0232721 [Helianthus annuus]